MIRHILAGLALLWVLGATDASAQAPATVKLCVQNGTTCTPVTAGAPLPVSGGGGGTTTANQGTAAAITGGWPVIDGAGTDTVGTLTSGAGTVNATIDGYASIKVQIKGTYAGFTFTTKVSSDGGTTFVPIQCALVDGSQFGTSFVMTANQSTELACGHQSGDDTFQISTASGPATGTANIDISPSAFPSDDGQTVAAQISQGGNIAVVKPASTAAVATDPALVVAISPNTPVGNGLVQTSPPSYTNATSQPLTLNAQGALPAASLNLGAFTCSALCSTTNRTLLSQNTWGYTTFSLQNIASDGSLLEIDVSYDNGTTWSQLPLETYSGTSGTSAQGQFSSFVPTSTSSAACARIPNPGGLVRVFFTAWSNGTQTVNASLSNSDSCAKPTTFSGGSVLITDINGNSNIPPVVCGSAVSSCVLKNASGFLYGVYANCTAACWLMVFNATSAPSNGATTAGIAAGNMVECIPIGAGSVGGVNYGSGPPSAYSTGITATISSTACSTLTLSTVGFIHGTVR